METLITPAMSCKSCKKSKNRETRSKTNDFKLKFTRILEVKESTRLRMEESPSYDREDNIARKGDNSLQHCNLKYKFNQMSQVMKTPAAKTAEDKEWEKLEKIPTWDVKKVRTKSKMIDEVRTKRTKGHFVSRMFICHLKNAKLVTKHQIYKGNCTPRRYCER